MTQTLSVIGVICGIGVCCVVAIIWMWILFLVGAYLINRFAEISKQRNWEES